MPVFAVQYSYVDQPEVVTQHRPAHRDFLRALLDQGIVLAAGAYTDGPAGALLIFRGDSQEHIGRILAEDPFQKLGLVQQCEIRAWGQAMGPWAG
ncbi:MAG: YciI family protein [Nakamurella sp.]